MKIYKHRSFHQWAKAEKLEEREEKLYRQIAKDFLTMGEEEIHALIKKDKLYEVK